ncbi:hypothetical protein BC831DRAFT_440729, partial [Entophlyctis helioformis]
MLQLRHSGTLSTPMQPNAVCPCTSAGRPTAPACATVIEQTCGQTVRPKTAATCLFQSPRTPCLPSGTWTRRCQLPPSPSSTTATLHRILYAARVPARSQLQRRPDLRHTHASVRDVHSRQHDTLCH